MTRIALTVGSPGLDVEIEPRFGRSAFILLVDPETMWWESLANPGWDARGGAGIRVAQVLSDEHVSDVVSGEFGPKAQQALETAGITMHRCGPGTTARIAVQQLIAGMLVDAPSSSRPRHRGGRR
jgi:predicted Fe-Mo cluster-binding NifX family protein